MITSQRHEHHTYSFVSSRVARLVCSAAAFAVVFFVPECATAQNRAPEEVFEYAEKQEATGVDTHFGPSCVDRLFEPFRRMDARLEAAGGPIFLGLYAPIWQIGSQGGPHDNMISQSLNLYGVVAQRLSVAQTGGK